MRPQNVLRRCICLVLSLHVAAAPMVSAQANSAAAQTDSATAPPDKPLLKPEELEQILAPIALYPDSLLSQIFMASTYPLEVVKADRWVKANADLKDDALATELEKQDWDPSVKSLVNFPQVLSMMSEKLDLTMKLGDAFIDQEADVMNTVQKLRAKAQAEGNLKPNEQQQVIVEAAPAPAAQTTVIVQQVPAPVQIIRIEPVQPSVVYVPTYNPVVVYGAWPYPAYPPYPYYPPRPPGYVASNLISFGAGVAVGAAWGYAWGNCNWGNNSVKINYNQNININNNINRTKYQNNINANGNWQHNPAHRQGVPYDRASTAQKFGGTNQSAKAAQARDAYRGRTDAGQQAPARNNANPQNRPAATPARGDVANRGGDRAGAGRGATVQDRAGAGAQNRPAASPANRPAPSDSKGAFSGVDQGGGAVRAESQRGQSSRSGSAPARPAPKGGGGAPRGGGGGGGASRSGGGGGGRR